MSVQHTIQNILLVTIIILLVLFISGCGSYIIDPPVKPEKQILLERCQLAARIKTDKMEYRKGEPVHIWFEIENVGTKTRQLDLHPKWDKQGNPTYNVGICLASHPTEYPGVWRETHYEQISKSIAPGETTRLVETVWDQTADTNAEVPVQHGYYDIGIILEYLYVDGGSTRVMIDDIVWGVYLNWNETEQQ